MVLEKKIDALADGRPKADDGEGNVEMGHGSASFSCS